MLEDEEALAAGLDATRPPKRFLPFAAGLRNCIGQNLAKMNAHATLAVLLSRFSFQLPAEVRPAADQIPLTLLPFLLQTLAPFELSAACDAISPAPAVCMTCPASPSPSPSNLSVCVCQLGIHTCLHPSLLLPLLPDALPPPASGAADGAGCAVGPARQQADHATKGWAADAMHPPTWRQLR